MIYLVSLIIVLGILILIHELGHYLAARAVGIYVVRFSFGLGPKTPLAWKIGETEYCISWVPFGGYVKMAGLEEEGPTGDLEGPKEEANIPPDRTFDAKPLWARVLVISAGVLMNLAFAVVVYAFMAGRYGVRHDATTTVGEVRSASLPLGAAGLTSLQPGDRILRINGDTMVGWQEIEMALITTVRTPVEISVAGRAEPVLVDVPLSEQENRAKVIEALVPWHQPVLGEVVRGDSAASAGLLPGDRIVRAAGDTVPSWETLVRIIEAHPGQAMPVVVQRGENTLALTVTPRSLEQRQPDGTTRTVGKIGAGVYREVRHYGFAGAIGQGFVQTWNAAGLVVFTLKGLMLGQLSPRDIGGPILIGQLSGEAAKLGLRPFLEFLSLFSVNLAVLNLLPIPVLDGGHLVFLLIEGIRRKPVSVAARQRWMTVGLVLVLALMVLAIYNDVLRLIR